MAFRPFHHNNIVVYMQGSLMMQLPQLKKIIFIIIFTIIIFMTWHGIAWDIPLTANQPAPCLCTTCAEKCYPF